MKRAWSISYSPTPPADIPVCPKCGGEDMRWESFGKYKGEQRYRWRCRTCDNERVRTRNNEIRKRAASLYRENHPDRQEARRLTMKAITCGVLIRQPCERCGKTTVDAHHEDYAKPFEIMWLCRRHHHERHRELAKAHRARELAEYQAAFSLAINVAKAAVAAGMTPADVEAWSKAHPRRPLVRDFAIPRNDPDFFVGIPAFMHGASAVSVKPEGA